MIGRVGVLMAFMLLTLRGEIIELPWEPIGQDLKIWKPQAFDSEGSWPAIIYYHGTHGRPTVDLLLAHGAGRDFVLVGTSYRTKGRFQYDPQTIADELGLLNALKRMLVEQLAVDPERIFVAGFSKGGWHSAMLLERDRSLAGGMILGGGVFRPDSSAEVAKFGSSIPVFIGSGREDGNYPQSLRALVHFRKLGADVTLEAWPGVGHAWPDEPAPAMKQWLRLQAKSSDWEKEARTWLKQRKGEIETLDDAVERWLALETFIGLPFVSELDSAEKDWARDELDRLLRDAAVQKEKGWRDELRAILRWEIRDLRVSTLIQAAGRYEQLAARAAGSPSGKLAAADAKRTRRLLATAKVREVGQPREPMEVPAAPAERAGEKRGFPLKPGTKVKPAK